MSNRTHRWALVVLGFLLWMLASHARADTEWLDWRAPDSCPTQSFVEHRVATWLSDAGAQPRVRNLEVSARVIRETGGYRLTLVICSATGHAEESVFAERCETLVDVTALKVTLAAAPVAVSDHLHETAQDAQRLAYARGRWGLRASADATWAVLPGTSYGVLLAGSYQHRWLRAEAGARYGFAKRLRYGSPSEVGAEIRSFTGLARACAVTFVPIGSRRRSLQFGSCAGLEAGVMRGEGVGLTQTRASRQPWAAATFGGLLGIPWAERGALVLEVQGLAVLTEVTYHARGLPDLFDAARAGFRTTVGLELLFP